jgi:hypothetical protein
VRKEIPRGCAAVATARYLAGQWMLRVPYVAEKENRCKCAPQNFFELRVSTGVSERKVFGENYLPLQTLRAQTHTC